MLKIKNIKMTNRDWYLFIGFIVCCILIADMVGDMIVYARKDESKLSPLGKLDVECLPDGKIKLKSGLFASLDTNKIIDWCNQGINL